MYIENPKKTVLFNKVIYQGHWIQGQYIKTIVFCFFIYQQQINKKRTKIMIPFIISRTETCKDVRGL